MRPCQNCKKGKVSITTRFHEIIHECINVKCDYEEIFINQKYKFPKSYEKSIKHVVGVPKNFYQSRKKTIELRLKALLQTDPNCVTELNWTHDKYLGLLDELRLLTDKDTILNHVVTETLTFETDSSFLHNYVPYKGEENHGHEEEVVEIDDDDSDTESDTDDELFGPETDSEDDE